MYSQTPEWTHS